ncbi:MAG: hypothetical protein AB7O28_00200 [Vicinamibacterales bacterium]
MNELRVPTTCLPVEIRCTDGRLLLGDIFMPAHSSRQPGPMRPDEWCDTVQTFFPVRSRDARTTTLLSRDAVVSVTVPASANEDDAESHMDSPVARVVVEAAGARYEGDLVVDMPPGHQRVADWLNAPAAFITLRAGVAHHLIQKRHVTAVVELDGGRR